VVKIKRLIKLCRLWGLAAFAGTLAIAAGGCAPRAVDEDAPVPASSAKSGFGQTRDALTFCRFGPKLKVLEQVFTPTPADTLRTENTGWVSRLWSSVVRGDDPKGCSGTAKIQTVSWECGESTEAESHADRLLRQMLPLAEAECKKHCESRTHNCHGIFQPQARCGLMTDTEDAVAAGERYRCGKGCAGKGFIYCSIYDAGFKTDDPVLIAPQLPNCRCVPVSPSAGAPERTRLSQNGP